MSRNNAHCKHFIDFTLRLALGTWHLVFISAGLAGNLWSNVLFRFCWKLKYRKWNNWLATPNLQTSVRLQNLIFIFSIAQIFLLHEEIVLIYYIFTAMQFIKNIYTLITAIAFIASLIYHFAKQWFIWLNWIANEKERPPSSPLTIPHYFIHALF